MWNAERASCKALISIEEAKKPLKQTPNNNPPGQVDLSREFYLKFSDTFGTNLVKSYNFASVNNNLAESQTLA